jgi:uncharacterized membrane protein HdeD (DUF308 family)
MREEEIMGDRGETKPPRGSSAAWGVPFLFGFLIALCGVVALCATGIAGYTSAILFGILLTSAGVFEFIEGIRMRHQGPTALYLLAGVLTAVVGVLFLLEPGIGLASLTLLLACYFFASGLFRLITSVADRYHNWGWDFAYGVLAIVLGAITVSSWPTSSLWLVGTLVGFELFFRGTTLMAASLGLRRGIRTLGIWSRPTMP